MDWRQRDRVTAADRGVVVHGRTYAYLVDHDGLCATVLWDAPDEDDARAMTTLWAAEFAMPRHMGLFDAGRVTAINPAAFAVIRECLTTHEAAYARVLRRQAIVAPLGVVGATIAGYYAVHRGGHPAQVFTERTAALTWLGRPDLEPALTALDAAGGDADARAALARWLRTAELAAATLPRAADALRTAPRSLQRRLARAGTSFARELARAQLARAQELMLATDAKLRAIAAAVGCASMSTFNQLFRREVGETPSAWRAKRRAAAPP